MFSRRIVATFFLSIQLSNILGYSTNRYNLNKKKTVKIAESCDMNGRSGHNTHTPFSISTNRRSTILSISSTLAFFSAGVLSPKEAHAFQNRISDDYSDRPKRKGPKPKDLGVNSRTDIFGDKYVGLKNCGSAPNCFCSTDSIEDDPEHNIPSWKWPSGYGSDLITAKIKAFEKLQEVIEQYKPGQNNIDGGGFKVMEFDSQKGYLYVQFESLKNGYIDDFEIAFIDGANKNEVQIRSSSRVGYLDFGVNGYRINYIAKALREIGWDAPGVDFEKHREYAIQNGIV